MILGFDAADAQVDHDSSGLDVVGGDQIRLAHGCDEHLSSLGMSDQVARGDVACGHGGHLVQQKQRDRAADNSALTDDDHLGTVNVHATVFEQFHGCPRCARRNDRPVVEDHPDVGWIHTLHVLIPVNAILHLSGVDAFGQRQQQDDTRDGRVGIKLLDPLLDLGGRGLGRCSS